MVSYAALDNVRNCHDPGWYPSLGSDAAPRACAVRRQSAADARQPTVA
jgi:hypothetical protein